MNTYARDNRAGLNRSKAGVLASFDVRAANLLLMAAILASFVSYLALNNGVSTKGFMLRALEHKISELEEEKQKLNLAAVEGQSMDMLDGRIQELGFVPVGQLEFVSAPGGAVAVR